MAKILCQVVDLAVAGAGAVIVVVEVVVVLVVVLTVVAVVVDVVDAVLVEDAGATWAIAGPDLNRINGLEGEEIGASKQRCLKFLVATG